MHPNSLEIAHLDFLLAPRSSSEDKLRDSIVVLHQYQFPSLPAQTRKITPQLVLLSHIPYFQTHFFVVYSTGTNARCCDSSHESQSPKIQWKNKNCFSLGDELHPVPDCSMLLFPPAAQLLDKQKNAQTDLLTSTVRL